MSKTPTDADIIFNRANVALARSQRLIQSWLPPKTAEEVADEKTDQELQKEEEQLFAPTPELLGLGAAVPDAEQDGLFKKRTTASNHRLLEQLLGKKAAKSHIASSKAPTSALQQAQKAALPVSDDDDEESRARVVASGSSKNKRPQTKKRPAPAKSREASAPERQSSDEEEDTRPSKKRPGSYLDQLLAEKATKKKRKQKA